MSKRSYSSGKLLSHPLSTFTPRSFSHGLQSLPSFESKRTGLLYIPKSYKDTEPAPLILMLHGAGCDAKQGIEPLMSYADENNFILVAPKSKKPTWDCIRDQEYGDDVAFVDQILEYLFKSFNINSGQIGIEGFSDGATYALSLGLANQDLFTSIMAFSPGFMYFPPDTTLAPSTETVGTVRHPPKIFFSHGKQDRVLSVERCSRRIAKQLKQCGFEHHYLEFEGGHTIPSFVLKEAVKWFHEKVGTKSTEVEE